MRTIETIAEMKSLSREWRSQGKTIGFAPTMGALHAGHLSLVKRAHAENDRVVVSIFVNPTQFNDPKDLETYPRPLSDDLNLLKAQGIDAVFLPKAEEIYADGFRFALIEGQLSQILCGPKRPGHFTGVLTVVLKLLNIVEAQKAYFGEKDFQQLKLIQDMSKALFLNTDIVGCPTLRESDGLAMSSRNARLTPEQRQKAPEIFHVLTSKIPIETARQRLSELGFQVDYVEEHWGRRFVAAFLGQVRLIDNA